MLFKIFLISLVATCMGQLPSQPLQPTQNAACNPQQAISNCIQPAVRHFLHHYEERKKSPLTGAKWTKELATQCELDFNGRKCVADFMKRCFPSNIQSNSPLFNTTMPVCQEKVNNITQGCRNDPSVWHEKCKNLLVDKLYLYLMTNPADPSFTPEKARQIHHQLCCEIKRYDVCVSAKTATECVPPAQQVFREIMGDMYTAYQCDAKTAFANLNC